MEGMTMDKLAFIIGDNFVYWNSIVLTLAAMVAILFFLSFYIGKGGNVVAGFAAVPLCVGPGLGPVLPLVLPG